MSITNTNLPYRPCVGLVLFNKDGHVFVGSRIDSPGAWQMPQGGVDENEATIDAVIRELKEETGLEAASYQVLGRAHLSNSVSDEEAIWYLATGLTLGEAEPEGSEELAVRRLAFFEALEMVQQGEITDALSVLAINSYALKLLK